MDRDFDVDIEVMDAVFDDKEHNVADAIVALSNHYHLKGFKEGIKRRQTEFWEGFGITIFTLFLMVISYFAGSENLFG